MRLYLDDDSANPVLAHLLRQAGHDVQMPIDAGLVGKDDAIHLTYTVEDQRVCLTGNHDDFFNLHNLLMRGQGHHSGIFVVRRDNDARRDMTPRGIVTAIRNFEASGAILSDGFYILNHWR